MTTKLILLNAFFFTFISVLSSAHGNPSSWDRVDITWPSFTALPITEDAAISGGWSKVSGSAVSSQSQSCSFVIYQLNNDISTGILFNEKGLFTGIQVGTSNANQNGGIWPNGPWEKNLHSNGSAYYTITAFTRDPTDLCASTDKIGTGVWLQSGPFNASSFLALPLNETDAQHSQKIFQKGKCFVSMGSHYWSNFTADTVCQEIFPVFLLYNSGQLNAFGWVLDNLPTELGSRWEHPSGSQLDLFLDGTRRPTCLFETGRVLSTQHIYFTQPALDFC